MSHQRVPLAPRDNIVDIACAVLVAVLLVLLVTVLWACRQWKPIALSLGLVAVTVYLWGAWS